VIAEKTSPNVSVFLTVPTSAAPEVISECFVLFFNINVIIKILIVNQPTPPIFSNIKTIVFPNQLNF